MKDPYRVLTTLVAIAGSDGFPMSVHFAAAPRIPGHSRTNQLKLGRQNSWPSNCLTYFNLTDCDAQHPL